MIWRKWKFWLAVVATATLIGLLESAQFYTGTNAAGETVSWVSALASTMPSWYVLAALVPAVIWLSRRFPLEPARWRRSVWVHLAMAVVFAGVHITTSTWFSYVLQPEGAVHTWVGFGRIFSSALSLFFVVDLVTYFALVGAYHAYDYWRRYRERESAAAQLALKASRLEASLARANLDALRMQLNPHFLFNTLNAISVLALKGERQGVMRMLSLLSELLRVTLEQKQQVVPLREELELLERYLQIEQVRFRDRLTIERDIDDAVLDAEVPSLLLQPLVENAIRHGISGKPGAGEVRIEAHARDGNLELRVLDTGPGFSEEVATGRTGVGLVNTRARLEQLYGAEQDLELGNRTAGGAEVTVRLPLRLCNGAAPERLPSAATA